MRVENVASGPEGLAAGKGKTGTVGRSPVPTPSSAGVSKRKPAGRGSPFRPTAQNGRTSRAATSTSSFRWKAIRITSTSLRTTRRSQIEATGGHQRPADGPARTARDDGRREQLHLHRQVVRRAEGADRTRVGGAIHSKPPRPRRRSIRPTAARPRALRFPLERAEDPDGDRITDYHFMLANRQDMRWPVDELRQTDFADGGQGRANTRLAQHRPADWRQNVLQRVRAKDQKGVWGLWSKTFSFTPQGAELPAGGRGYDKDKGIGTLEVEGQPGRPEAGEVPRVRQRRERLFGERRALPSQHRRRRS